MFVYKFAVVYMSLRQLQTEVMSRLMNTNNIGFYGEIVIDFCLIFSVKHILWVILMSIHNIRLYANSYENAHVLSNYRQIFSKSMIGSIAQQMVLVSFSKISHTK